MVVSLLLLGSCQTVEPVRNDADVGGHAVSAAPEAGSVSLDLLVGSDSQVLEATVGKTSGFQKIDEAAVQHALQAWRFTPGTVNDKPPAFRQKVKVTFKAVDH